MSTTAKNGTTTAGSGWVKNDKVVSNPTTGWDCGPQMYVIKRSGAKEAIAFDKISKRLKKCCKEIQTVEINTTKFALRVIEQLHDNITTQKIDEITADLAASMSSQHYDYNTLAGRIIISNMHKSTPTTFSKSVKKLYQYVDKHGKACPLVSAEYYQTVMAHAKVLDTLCGDCSRDYLIDYFGYKTLEKAYLMRVNGVVVERPQYMWMRVAVALHMDSVVGIEGDMLDRIRETYEMLSSKHFIMATPTLFNIGTPRPQCSSCFLVAMEDDSVDGIFSTLTDCARISKYAGGIGLHIHNIRATGSHINGTNGTSDGIVPMLRMFNQTARYINQSGKRNGSFAIYLEPWHADVEMFLQMKTNHGDEELKARDLFYAMWIPDLFMERVKSEGQWTLMCPDECRGLADVYGDEFRTLYESYEKAGKGRVTMPARDLWLKILDAQMETGTPYLLYKDAANRKSNQKNLGTIKSSNLCVAPETLVLTEQGHLPIQDLCGKRVNVWNGHEFSEVEVVQTGEQQPLIEVHTTDNMTLHCTPYHKFYIQNGFSRSPIQLMEAKDLQPGYKILKCEYPCIDGKEEMNYAYTHGFFCGDGTYFNNNTDITPVRCAFKCTPDHLYCKRHLNYETKHNEDRLRSDTTMDQINCNAMSYEKKPTVYLYAEKKELVQYIERIGNVNENGGRLIIRLPYDIQEKFFVPLNHSLKCKMEWFAGYCDADGTIANNQSNQQLQISSISEEFLNNVKLMLQTCGINPKISINRAAGTSMLPDGRGGNRLFDTQTVFRMMITSVELNKLVVAGFAPKRLKLHADNIPNRCAKQYIKIESVVDNGRIDDTYCFTEPLRHAGIFNGIYTSQCVEVVQYSDKTETGVCNLSSVALPAFVSRSEDAAKPTFDFEKLHKVTRQVT